MDSGIFLLIVVLTDVSHMTGFWYIMHVDSWFHWLDSTVLLYGEIAEIDIWF